MDKFINELIHNIDCLNRSNPGKNIIILLGHDEREKLENWYRKEISTPGQQRSNLYNPWPGERTFYGYMVVYTSKRTYHRYVTDIKL